MPWALTPPHTTTDALFQLFASNNLHVPFPLRHDVHDFLARRSVFSLCALHVTYKHSGAKKQLVTMAQQLVSIKNTGDAGGKNT